MIQVPNGWKRNGTLTVVDPTGRARIQATCKHIFKRGKRLRYMVRANDRWGEYPGGYVKRFDTLAEAVQEALRCLASQEGGGDVRPLMDEYEKEEE